MKKQNKWSDRQGDLIRSFLIILFVSIMLMISPIQHIIQIRADAFTYPFRVGANRYASGVKLSGPDQVTVDSWATMSIEFNSPVNLSYAQYIVIQLKSVVGTPGITWGIYSGGDSGTRYTIAGPGNDGKPVYFYE